jgi:hypothetical protein
MRVDTTGLITDTVLSNTAENTHSPECEDPSLLGCYALPTDK